MGELSAEETSVGGVDVPERWELDSDGEEEGGGIDKGVGGWAVDVDVVDELAALAGESRLPLGPLSHRAQNARGATTTSHFTFHFLPIFTFSNHPSTSLKGLLQWPDPPNSPATMAPETSLNTNEHNGCSQRLSGLPRGL